MKCEWWLAFVLHPISLFSFLCFDLPITRTFFDFPWRFYLEGSSIGFSGSGISLISGLGFGTLKQNRGGIRDKKYAWMVGCQQQPSGLRDSLKFLVGITGLKNPIGDPLFAGSRLWKSRRSVQRVKHGNWRKCNIAVKKKKLPRASLIWSNTS